MLNRMWKALLRLVSRKYHMLKDMETALRIECVNLKINYEALPDKRKGSGPSIRIQIECLNNDLKEIKEDLKAYE